ncbi:MAG: sulfatase-like hydrolase/transferase, partial [Chloroflexota bacterium]
AIQQNAPTVEDAFVNDFPVAFNAFPNFLGVSDFYTRPASMTYALMDMLWVKQTQIEATPNYPKGYPYNYFTYFHIKDILAGLSAAAGQLAAGDSPFLAYYHLLPPHAPYNPQKKFIEPFIRDGLTFPAKPIHPLSTMRNSQDKLDRQRLAYDSFIANIDFELDTFLRTLYQDGTLNNSYLFITTDHGEIFERGDYGHGVRYLPDGLCHIPLIVFAPGQTKRRDVTSLTSNVDLVPTILSLAGRDIPSHIEGRVLPGLGGSEDADRSVFTVFAQENSAFAPLSHAAMSMNKGTYRLNYTRGYPGDYEDKVELYNLADDPEEMRDLANEDTVTTKRMKEELLTLADAADKPYQRK